MKELSAKTILQKTKPNLDFWFYNDYNMNLYRGCSHGCIYCDSRSLCYGIEDFERILPKKDSIKILEAELIKKRKVGIIAMGSMSDPYNPLEKKLENTRQALELIHKYGYGTQIITKSALILRDLDILKEINKSESVLVNITITTANPILQKQIEPYSSTTEDRFAALKTLNENGIKAGICLMPILPFINDTLENLDSLLEMAKAAKVNHIYPWFGLTMRDRQREYLYKKLDESFPGVKAKYQKTFGSNYRADSPNSKALYQRLAEKCKEYGILFEMRDINKSFIKPPKQLQLEL